MTFALTCALCLAGSSLGAGTGTSTGLAPSAPGAALESPIPAGPAYASLDLGRPGDGTAWYQHQHGDSQPQDESGHDGHSMMGTTMIVVMVAMMVVVGGLVMMRGSRAAAAPTASSPAALAIPVSAPRGGQPSGG